MRNEEWLERVVEVWYQSEVVQWNESTQLHVLDKRPKWQEADVPEEKHKELEDYDAEKVPIAFYSKLAHVNHKIIPKIELQFDPFLVVHVFPVFCGAEFVLLVLQLVFLAELVHESGLVNVSKHHTIKILPIILEIAIWIQKIILHMNIQLIALFDQETKHIRLIERRREVNCHTVVLVLTAKLSDFKVKKRHGCIVTAQKRHIFDVDVKYRIPIFFDKCQINRFTKYNCASGVPCNRRQFKRDVRIIHIGKFIWRRTINLNSTVVWIEHGVRMLFFDNNLEEEFETGVPNTIGPKRQLSRIVIVAKERRVSLIVN